MYIIGAVILSGVIGALGGYFIGWDGLFVTVPVAFALGWIAEELESRR